MYVLACCDNDGRCIGFLNNNKECESRREKVDDMEWVKENLMIFKQKKDTTEICNQINLSHTLFDETMRYPFRVASVKM